MDHGSTSVPINSPAVDPHELKWATRPPPIAISFEFFPPPGG
jgi:hypothetical protein